VESAAAQSAAQKNATKRFMRDSEYLTTIARQMPVENF
jgi:hypothetical protein